MPKKSVDAEGNVEASDTVTVEGRGDPADIEPFDTKTAEAMCETPVNAGISVTKECDVELDFSTDTIQVQVSFDGEICNTGNLALSNLTISDSEAGSITPSQTTLAPAECIDYSGSYLPSTTDGGDDPDPEAANFSDTVTVMADSAVGVVMDDDPATCELCPD